jgi:hypothetical protein
MFDKSCKKHRDWVATERDKSLLQFEHRSNGVISDARNSSSTPNINSSIHIPHCSSTLITRSYSTPESAFQNTSDDGTTPSDPAIRPSAQSSPSSSPHLITELSPTQKLSRSMRVFVAWKASS